MSTNIEEEIEANALGASGAAIALVPTACSNILGTVFPNSGVSTRRPAPWKHGVTVSFTLVYYTSFKLPDLRHVRRAPPK